MSFSLKHLTVSQIYSLHLRMECWDTILWFGGFYIDFILYSPSNMLICILRPNSQSLLGPKAKQDLFCKQKILFFFFKKTQLCFALGRVSIMILWLGIARKSLEHLRCPKYLEYYFISWVIHTNWCNRFLCKREQLQFLILFSEPFETCNLISYSINQGSTDIRIRGFVYNLKSPSFWWDGFPLVCLSGIIL